MSTGYMVILLSIDVMIKMVQIINNYYGNGYKSTGGHCQSILNFESVISARHEDSTDYFGACSLGAAFYSACEWFR